MKERRIEHEAIVPNAEARALLPNTALSHHGNDVAARHRVDEDCPLLERRALVH